ncbi:hypothetical protein ACFV19_07025 [Streptomyces griseoluteus]|uniref:hypothetical protein n=1 Tax=Streptomyces griseoluteus TaxID=29306 RepID=UPI00367EB326
MAEGTQTELSTTIPQDWCHWHKGVGPDARITQAIEGGSGPGYTLSACAPCRAKRGLIPLADQPQAGVVR